MSQVSFKLPSEEMKFLRWYSEKKAVSMSVLYKEVTLDSFKQWKLQTLLDLYAKGTIGFKQLCNLGGISFQEGLLLIENADIEPPISETVDQYTDSVRDKLIAELE